MLKKRVNGAVSYTSYPFKYTKFKLSGVLKCAEINFDYKLFGKPYLVENCDKKKINNYLNKN